MNPPDVARFEAHRTQLEGLAYRMLGIHAEAEDVVQEAYLRWSAAAAREEIHDDRAFLRAAVTRLAVDRLQSARARREMYVGPWLPEPVLDDPASQPEDAAVLADDVSFALLLALERLSPLERAAFVLHDVLGMPFAEIAATLGRTPESVRTLASRARDDVRSTRKRRPVLRSDAERMRTAFTESLRDGDVGRLTRLLAEDVVLLSDGGGKATAAINPLIGTDRVGRFLVGINRKNAGDVRRVVSVAINGDLGFVTFGSEGILHAYVLETDGERINAIYIVRNPDKLQRLTEALAGS